MSNQAKESEKSNQNTTIDNIINNYVQNEKALIDQLSFKIGHGPTIGGYREDIWRGMFEQIVPRKFVIEQSVFIMDSKGNVSNEVDLAIFDETYTPYIFRYGRLKFIPIEAVAVVVECKSTSPDKKDLQKWAKSILPLSTSTDTYARMFTDIVVGGSGDNGKGSTQTATRPLRILCCVAESFENNFDGCEDAIFDIVIKASTKKNELSIEMDPDKKTLQDWYLSLNHVGHSGDLSYDGKKIKNGEVIRDVKISDYEVKKGTKAVSLLTFNLQLNQLLMLINNPMLFPHLAYARRFDIFAKEGAENERKADCSIDS